MTDNGIYQTSRGDDIAGQQIGLGESFNFTLTTEIQNDTKYFEFTEFVQIRNITIFWKNAPKGSKAIISIVDSQNNDISKMLVDMSLVDSNGYGYKACDTSVKDIEAGEKIKVFIENATPNKAFDVWGLFSIIRSKTV